jgi:hypothetical protein
MYDRITHRLIIRRNQGDLDRLNKTFGDYLMLQNRLVIDIPDAYSSS